MDIIISNTSGVPIYEQIEEQIKSQIMTGSLVAGEALPSMRVLAKELKISIITTKRAYEELEKEGVIVSVPGKGFYVCKQNNDFLKEKQRSYLEERYLELLKESRNAGMDLKEILSMIEILYEEGGKD